MCAFLSPAVFRIKIYIYNLCDFLLLTTKILLFYTQILIYNVFLFYDLII